MVKYLSLTEIETVKVRSPKTSSNTLINFVSGENFSWDMDRIWEYECHGNIGSPSLWSYEGSHWRQATRDLYLLVISYVDNQTYSICYWDRNKARGTCSIFKLSVSMFLFVMLFERVVLGLRSQCRQTTIFWSEWVVFCNRCFRAAAVRCCASVY